MAIATTKEVADIFGVTDRQVKTWLTEGVPLHKRGGPRHSHQFDTVEVHRWLMERELADRVTVDVDGELYDKHQEEARLKHHQADLAELEVRERKGELYRIDEVLMLCAAMYSTVRNRVLAIHSKFAGKFPGADPEFIEEIEDLSVDALSDLGRDGIPPGLERTVAEAVSRMQSSSEEDG